MAPWETAAVLHWNDDALTLRIRDQDPKLPGESERPNSNALLRTMLFWLGYRVATAAAGERGRVDFGRAA